MSDLKKCIALAMKQYKKEYGDNSTLADGEEFATVLNDGVLIIGREAEEIKIKFLVGKPYFVDFNINNK